MTTLLEFMAESVWEVSALSFLTKAAGKEGFIFSVATVILPWQSKGTSSPFALTAVCKVSVTGRRWHPSALPAAINQWRIMQLSCCTMLLC